MRSNGSRSPLKKTPQYRERDEEKRAAYKAAMADYAPENRIYLDESGFDERQMRTHGYAEKGKRVHGLLSGQRGPRTNVIGAYSCDRKLLATETYDRTINKHIFLKWVKTKLVPHLRQGMAIIMDNAPWHKSEEIRQAIENTGAKLIFLAPYSPDLNPIEHAWANLKRAVQSAADAFDSFLDHLHAQLKNSNLDSTVRSL